MLIRVRTKFVRDIDMYSKKGMRVYSASATSDMATTSNGFQWSVTRGGNAIESQTCAILMEDNFDGALNSVPHNHNPK